MRRKLMRVLSTAMRSTSEEVKEPVSSNLLGGLNVVDTPEKLQDNEFTELANWDIRDQKLVRRNGFDLYVPAKPDSNKVLGFFGLRRFNGTVTTLRFTRNSVYKVQTGAWVAIAGPALSSTDDDYWRCFIVEDRIFASNGVDVLYEINTTLNTYAAAGNAREYEFYCIANRRICAANLKGASPNPIEFATSGNRNYTQWDPATDISAFRNSLVDAEEDTSDEITGLFGIKDSVIILRSRSIWVGTPQPIASAPFAFRKVVSGIGCTCPKSAVKVSSDSIIFFDPTTKQIYQFFLRDDGSTDLQEIGNKVYTSVYSSVSDVRKVSGVFDPKSNEYHLCIDIEATSTANIWKYVIDHKAWLFDTILNATSLSYPYVESFIGSIESLGTVPISSLVGTIAGLSSFVTHDTKRYALLSTGDILEESSTSYTDAGNEPYVTLKSKTYLFYGKQMHVLGMVFRASAVLGGYFTVNFLKNTDPAAFWFSSKTMLIDYKKTVKTLPFKKHLLCDSFAWQLYIPPATTPETKKFELHNYVLRVTEAGDY